MKRKGFTLIELLVVISIITILAALVVPNIGKLMERGRRGKATADLKLLADSVKFYYTEHGQFPESLSLLVKENYLSKDVPNTPWGEEYKYVYADVAKSSSSGEEGTSVTFLDQPDTKVGFRIYVDRYDDGYGTSVEGEGSALPGEQPGPIAGRKPICYVEEKFE